MIGKCIQSILRGIGKVFAYLFVTLGLWLPALYSLAYLVAVGVSHKLRLQGGVLAVFFVGLGVTVVGGLALSMHRASRKKSAKDSAPPLAPAQAEEEPRRRGGKRPPVAAEPSAAPAPSTQAYADQMRTMYADAYAAGYADARAQAARASSLPDDRSDLDQKYFPQGKPAPTTYADPSQPYADAHYAAPAQPQSTFEADTGADMLWRRLTGEEVPDEQPMLYRTRRDPYLFVREYSDRYQYWRQTARGMVLERTEFKQPTSRYPTGR